MRLSAHTSLKGAVLFSMAAWVSGGLSVAQVDPWERVRLLEEGKNVSVTLHSGAQVNGKMQAWSADSVRIQQGKTVVPVEKEKIARVELVAGMSRGKKAAVAGGITGGIMVGLVGLACGALNCRASEFGKIASVDGAIFGGGAAGIAALFPPHKELIYAAPPPEGSWRGTTLLYSQTAYVKSGERFQFRIRLNGEGGRAMSSPLLSVRAVGVSPALDPPAPVTPLSPATNPNDLFRYDARFADSGGYRFDLDTRGFEPGAYYLHYQVGTDPTTHTVPFRVK